MADLYLLRHETFSQDDLVIVPPPVNPVILKSGGAVMSAVEEKDGMVLCEWSDGRQWYPAPCLYRCTLYSDGAHDVQKS